MFFFFLWKTKNIVHERFVRALVADGSVRRGVVARTRREEICRRDVPLLPIIPYRFVRLNNICNIIRYFYGGNTWEPKLRHTKAMWLGTAIRQYVAGRRRTFWYATRPTTYLWQNVMHR